MEVLELLNNVGKVCGAIVAVASHAGAWIETRIYSFNKSFILTMLHLMRVRELKQLFTCHLAFSFLVVPRGLKKDCEAHFNIIFSVL